MTQKTTPPASIRAHVAASAIDRVTRFFTATLDDTFVKPIANARRSDPTRIHVDTERSPHGGTFVLVADDGCGIADPSVLPAFGRSGWDRAAADREDPAGIGIYALSRTGSCIASWTPPPDSRQRGHIGYANFLFHLFLLFSILHLDAG